MTEKGNPTWDEVRGRLHAEDPELAAAYEESEPAFQVAKELIRIRHERGISQSEVARRMGTAPSVISRLEKMETRPTLATVFALARALACAVEIRFISKDANGAGDAGRVSTWEADHPTLGHGYYVGPPGGLLAGTGYFVTREDLAAALLSVGQALIPEVPVYSQDLLKEAMEDTARRSRKLLEGLRGEPVERHEEEQAVG